MRFQFSSIPLPALILGAGLNAAAEPKVEFSRDVRPILAAKCYACHGPDGDKRKADPRLDVRAEAVREVIKPGDPDASELWKRVTTHEADDVMPPPSSPKQLGEFERGVLRRWIAQGAEYQEHWAFLPVRRPARLVVGRTGGIRNAIDFFIGHELDAHHLKPAPEADPATLIRRACLDFIGLPPSPGEVAAYVRDNRPSCVEQALRHRPRADAR